MKIEVIGRELLDAKILALPYTVRNYVLKRAINKSNKLLVDTVRKRAPIDSRILRKSITSVVRTYKKGYFVLGVVGPNKDYSGYVVMKPKGKSSRKSKPGEAEQKGIRKPVRYAHLVEGGTSLRKKKSGASTGSVTAEPFMKPSMDELKDKIREIFETEVDDAINDLMSS
jgi:hypothetical protein